MEKPMLQDCYTPTPGTGCHQILANRLFQLAADTGRVGLHREASALATVAASVRDGRPIDVRDA